MRSSFKKEHDRKIRAAISHFYDNKEREAAIKEAKKEEDKKNPLLQRLFKGRGVAQGINSDKQEVYELYYNKLDARVDQLYNLIIEDLGLDKDENMDLTPYNIYEIFNYYQDKGLMQLEEASKSEMMEFNKNKVAPYSKLFKKLIAKRAEFLIVAPKDRITSSSPFTRIKDEATQIELLKHMEDLKLLPNYDFSIKYPKLYNLYQEIKEENLGV